MALYTNHTINTVNMNISLKLINNNYSTVCLYSQFSTCRQITITDNPTIWTATKFYSIIGTVTIKETKETGLEGDQNNTR